MVYILLGTGFEEVEAVAPLDLLRRAGVEVLTVGLNGKAIQGAHNISVVADIEVGEMDLTAMDMIVLPGGLGGVAAIRASAEAMNAVQFAWDNGKFVAAICAGPTVLADLHITDGLNVTCYPSCAEKMGGANYVPNVPCIRDGRVITGTSAGCAVPFGLALVEALMGEAAANTLAQQFVIR